MRQLALLFCAIWLCWGRFPYQWAHHLTPACEWHPRGLIGLFSVPQDDDAVWARARCKGAASRSPLVSEFVTKFPSAAQLAAWRNSDEGPLPTEDPEPSVLASR